MFIGSVDQFQNRPRYRNRKSYHIERQPTAKITTVDFHDISQYENWFACVFGWLHINLSRTYLYLYLNIIICFKSDLANIGNILRPKSIPTRMQRWLEKLGSAHSGPCLFCVSEFYNFGARHNIVDKIDVVPLYDGHTDHSQGQQPNQWWFTID